MFIAAYQIANGVRATMGLRLSRILPAGTLGVYAITLDPYQALPLALAVIALIVWLVRLESKISTVELNRKRDSDEAKERLESAQRLTAQELRSINTTLDAMDRKLDTLPCGSNCILDQRTAERDRRRNERDDEPRREHERR